VLDVEPDWSPNGRRIAFQRVDSNGCGPGCETDEIDVVNADRSRLTRLAYDPPGQGCMKGGLPANGVCREVPAWSPNGKQIAFECVVLQSVSGNPYLGHICVMNQDGSHVRQLAQTPTTRVADSAPAWSPDGRHIAFQRAVRNERGETIRDGVFVMNADGSNPRRVAPWGLRAAQPDWSPNGRCILFYSNWSGPASVSANLYTISPKGAGLRPLTRARGGNVQYLSATFSPDS
jgi:TolB protein